MAGIKEIAKGRSDIYFVKPSDLKVKEGWNSRDIDAPENREHLDQLAQSIKEKGVKQTLTIFREGEDLFIEDGHFRHGAALLAIEKYGADPEMTVPVRMGEKEATDADRILSQIIRNSGKPLAPLETATVFKKLRKLGMSDGDIGKQAGVSRVYVGQLIALSEMPKGVTEKVRDGSVSATLAIEVMKSNNGDGKQTAADLKEAVKTAQAAGKTRATKKHVKKGNEAPSPTDLIDKAVKSRKTTAKPIDVAREIIDGAEFAVVHDENDVDRVTLTFTMDDWETLYGTLGLTKGGTPNEDLI